ncbi:cytochrome c oxidase subunit 4 [Corynebacterium breve]|uniref:Cytochrome c oxidase polypeptide 4 n=1 Tax=Corynebacterium breve TaxID=3049799 RepID=A0ABY8VBF8_9CORY|nr:cytochrome c oxidase subunit 4 [Corynebacterium breve]WIM66999.1 cytochrome c oxidase subunit 4 [Corynebacterium breve]
MGPTAKLFYGLGAFLGVMAVLYALATNWIADDAWIFGYEWAGGVAIILATAMSFMLGGYLHFTERRMDVVPEDWEEAEIEDGAGVLGFFAPNSIWPFAMAGSVMFLGLGIAFWQLWLVAFGALALIGTTAMLNLQYGIPKEKH